MARKLIFILLIIFVAGVAGATNTPKYLNYQAVLFDEGGNPLPDGPTNLSVRILDSNMNVVYEEEQEVEVISGVVSLMIGNGTDPASGTLTGGIGAEVLLPDGPRYLEVQAEGYPAENLMELVSVPYSTYADVAFKVADESVGADQIREKSITINHLTDELVSELGNQIVGGDQITIVKKEEFNEYKNEISGSSGARNVGVNPDFTYTSAANLQDVLKDLDFAIKKREEDAVKVDENNLSRDGSDTMTGMLTLQSSGDQVKGTGWSISSGGATTVGTLTAGTTTVSSLDAGSGAIKTTGSLTAGATAVGSLTAGTTTVSSLNAGSGAIETKGSLSAGSTGVSSLSSSGIVNVSGLELRGNNEINVSGGGPLYVNYRYGNGLEVRNGGSGYGPLTAGGVSAQGDIETADDLIVGDYIRLGGVNRSKWSGFKSVYTVSNSRELRTPLRQGGELPENCWLSTNEALTFCKVSIGCDAGDSLLGCTGKYSHVCWGDKGCDFVGTYTAGNTCYAEAAQGTDDGDFNGAPTLSVRAICGERY